MDERVDEVLVKRALFASVFDLVTTASMVDVMIAFAMFKVFINDVFLLSPDEVDHISEESAEDDL